MQEIYSSAQAQNSSFEVSKVLRNTYMLLGMTLAFSALTCGLSHGNGPWSWRFINYVTRRPSACMVRTTTHS